MAITTLEKLDQTLSQMNTHPEYNRCIREQAYSDCLSDARTHSVLLEINGERNLLSPKEEATLYQNLNDAWEYLGTHGINLGTFAALGNIIDPEKNPHKNFRQSEVQIGVTGVPSSGQVPYYVKTLVEFLNAYDTHPVLRAIEAHIDLARIHPWNDRNGRGARLAQDYCLYQKSYPPAIISIVDRYLYTALLRGALLDREARRSTITDPSSSEKIFHEFIASKVLATAYGIEKELQKRRMYDIELGNIRDVAQLHTVAEGIRYYGRRRNLGISVRVEKKGKTKKTGLLRIVGDVGRDDLESILKSYTQKHPMKFHMSIWKKC